MGQEPTKYETSFVFEALSIICSTGPGTVARPHRLLFSRRWEGICGRQWIQLIHCIPNEIGMSNLTSFYSRLLSGYVLQMLKHLITKPNAYWLRDPDSF